MVARTYHDLEAALKTIALWPIPVFTVNDQPMVRLEHVQMMRDLAREAISINALGEKP